MSRRGGRGGTQSRSYSRGGEQRQQRSETYRVVFIEKEARELRSLLRDDEGDADEDVLEDVVAALAPGARRDRGDDALTLRLTREEKDACRRAISEQWRDSDVELQRAVVRKIDNALVRASQQD